MKRIVIIYFLLICNVSTFAQGWVTDDAVKDSSDGVFTGIFGVLLFLGLIWVISYLMDKKSENDDLSGKHKYDHLPSSSRIRKEVVKPNSKEEQKHQIAEEIIRKQQIEAEEVKNKAKLKEINEEAINILKSEYQEPFEYDGKTLVFKSDELKYETISAFCMGYYWGVTRQMTEANAPKETIRRAIPHNIVRLGYERGLKSPQREKMYVGVTNAPNIYFYLNTPSYFKIED